MRLRLARVCYTPSERALGFGGYDVGEGDAALFLFDEPQRMAFCGRGCDVDLYVNCVEGGVVRESFVVRAGDLSGTLSEGDSYQVVVESLHDLKGRSVTFGPGFVEVDGA